MFHQNQDFYHQQLMESGVAHLKLKMHLLVFKQEVTKVLMQQMEEDQLVVVNTELLL